MSEGVPSVRVRRHAPHPEHRTEQIRPRWSCGDYRDLSREQIVREELSAEFVTASHAARVRLVPSPGCTVRVPWPSRSRPLGVPDGGDSTRSSAICMGSSRLVPPTGQHSEHTRRPLAVPWLPSYTRSWTCSLSPCGERPAAPARISRDAQVAVPHHGPSSPCVCLDRRLSQSNASKVARKQSVRRSPWTTRWAPRWRVSAILSNTDLHEVASRCSPTHGAAWPERTPHLALGRISRSCDWQRFYTTTFLGSASWPATTASFGSLIWSPTPRRTCWG
jgi:hypothetical protein